MPYRKAAVRPFRAEDEPLLFALARQTFGARAGWSDERTLSVLEQETVFVAEVDGDVAGYVALTEESEQGAAVVDELLVAAPHEREGVGHQLLEWAEGWAISRGAESLRILVEDDNVAARDFYRRAGFAETAPRLVERVLPRRG